MSNQRAGKFKPAAMRDNDTNGLALRSFFRRAKELLEEKGDDDAAFYFEQCEEWISNARGPMNENSAGKVLGL
jgi:hypothetical protein